MHSFLDKKGKEYMLLKHNTCPKHMSGMTTATENNLLNNNISIWMQNLFQISASSETYLSSYKIESIKLTKDHWVHHLAKHLEN